MREKKVVRLKHRKCLIYSLHQLLRRSDLIRTNEKIQKSMKLHMLRLINRFRNFFIVNSGILKQKAKFIKMLHLFYASLNTSCVFKRIKKIAHNVHICAKYQNMHQERHIADYVEFFRQIIFHEKLDTLKEAKRDREREMPSGFAGILPCPSEMSYSCRMLRRQYFTPVGLSSPVPVRDLSSPSRASPPGVTSLARPRYQYF